MEWWFYVVPGLFAAVGFYFGFVCGVYRGRSLKWKAWQQAFDRGFTEGYASQIDEAPATGPGLESE